MGNFSMKRETLAFDDASADVTVIDNLIYFRISGVYNNEVALKLAQYLEKLISLIPESPIRVWDVRNVPAGAFQLSYCCIEQLSRWTRKIWEEKPGSLTYMVGSSTVSYGMARMYGIKTNLEGTAVFALRSTDELPAEIKEKLQL